MLHTLSALAFSVLVGCERAPQPVVVVGFDGLDRTLLERMVEDGELPHFGRLIEEGSLNDMALTRPIRSPILWTSMATGYREQEHGIGGWSTASGALFDASKVRSLRLWDAATRHGRSSLVVGWLVTWPASPIEGQMVTDRFAWTPPMDRNPHGEGLPGGTSSSRGLTYPSSLVDEAATWRPDQEWVTSHVLADQ
ncbi:MAG: alkaline phosphatase family protein, partial [Myxococcota bacterium]|nr:alkaline phosphatase family protein [Myxococcota bacterium]